MPRVQRIGNTLYVAIPKELAETLSLEEGELLQARIEEGRLVYERPVPKGSVWRLVPCQG
ncbi:MAG: AbrB/MazE/SpoVT family DNA-binding domain-containing protein [Deltaproteobacteria bacterium]|nr:AbrB/MazE/SpoVT family DNA-binding domain-containing protein [Deltaproteobacteria bacterium]